MESIDKLPLGIYKSIMAKAYRSLNNPIQYPYHNELNYYDYINRHISNSPLTITNYSKTNNKEKIIAKDNFFKDYLLDKL
jgi:hypothetical protein